ncbi:MAG: hypothetical protein K1X94_12285 [Sandaracinaceae bacterium]|nr:hypothetical protein [Sandaracinaceae bacterium]
MTHSFVVNGTRSNVAIGLGLVPALAFMVGVPALLERGGWWIAAAVGVGLVGVAYLLGLGALARRLGVRIEIDDVGVSRTERGLTRTIRWDRALTVAIETTPLRRGASLIDVRVDDGEGSPIALRIPAQLGRVLDPAAREALAIVEREARVPLSVREARRTDGARRAVPSTVIRGTYASFPRTGWVALGFAVFLPIPALKLFFVDHFTGALAPCFAGAAGFLFYVLAVWAWVGELELDEHALRGRRRLGARFVVPRHTIVRVAPIGSAENDTRGVAMTLSDGSVRRLPRLEPAALRDRLLAIAPRG